MGPNVGWMRPSMLRENEADIPGHYGTQDKTPPELRHRSDEASLLKLLPMFSIGSAIVPLT